MLFLLYFTYNHHLRKLNEELNDYLQLIQNHYTDIIPVHEGIYHKQATESLYFFKGYDLDDYIDNLVM